jgi:hypothetical protein
MNTEHIDAVLLMRAVIGAEGTWPELRWFHAIPNGGLRSKAVAVKMKAEGVRKGVSDYCLPVQRGGFAGLYIELKRVSAGRTSQEQRDFIAFVREQGYRAEVCKGWQQAWDAVRDYLAADGCEQMREAA